MTTPVSAPTARRISRRWPVISGGTAILLAIGLGLLVALRTTPDRVDASFLGEVVEHRSPFWTVPALVMNFIGGGWFGVFLVPIVVTALLLVLRRPWSAGYFLAATIVSAGLVQLLKGLYGRARPPEILVSADAGSFPSGHVANAATLAITLAIILQRAWVWFAGVAYIALMALSRTYLGAHWLTDTVGGALLGAAVGVLLWAPVAYRLQKEWARRRPAANVAL